MLDSGMTTLNIALADRRFYWEVILQLRKAVLVVVLVVPSDVYLSRLVASGVIVVLLFAHTRLKPFARR